LPNVWLGVSVENQQYADERIPLLLQTPAALRFISAEPLLGPLDLQPAVRYAPIDWVIVGGESGPGARPFDLAWARSIVQQCQAAGVACFVKQVGAKPVFEGTPVGVFEGYDYEDPKGGDPSEWPEDLRVREFPGVRQ
jgi:protein gp37